jgi:hypothetical protein
MTNYFLNQKKGASSVIMAVFLILVVLTLNVSVFSSIQISSNYLVENLQHTQEKEQEAIRLGTGSLIVENDLIKKIIVNNTGSILITIRALYVDSEFVFDPKVNINPQESAIINIDKEVSFSSNKYKLLAITTERGTKVTSIVRDLSSSVLEGGDSSVYGPLRFIYDEFHWTIFTDNFDKNYLKTTTWNDGWKVPPNIYAIWRIRVQNVDVRNLNYKFGENTIFAIMITDGGQRSYYYIDVQCSDISIRPREYADLYFVWSEPAPSSRTSQRANRIINTEGTYLNFLVLEGKIGNTDIAQTIPFHAVLISST